MKAVWLAVVIGFTALLWQASFLSYAAAHDKKYPAGAGKNIK